MFAPAFEEENGDKNPPPPIACGVCFELIELENKSRLSASCPCSHILCRRCLQQDCHQNDEDGIGCRFCQSVLNFAGIINKASGRGVGALNRKMTPDAKSTVSLEPPTTSAVVGAAAKSLPSYPEPIIKVERADSPTMKGVKWCLSCVSEWTGDCGEEGHLCIHVTTIDSIKNLQMMLILKEKLDAIRAEGRSKLSQAIEKRKMVQQYLNQVSTALSLCSRDILKMEEDNDRRMAELAVALEAEQKKVCNQQEEQERWLSETASLIEMQLPNNCAQDYAKPLQDLATNLVHSFEQKLTEASSKVAAIEMQSPFSISSSSLDDATKSLPNCWDVGADGRFAVNWRTADLESTPSVVRNLFLLTHFAFSINNNSSSSSQSHQGTRKSASPSGESSGVHSASSDGSNSEHVMEAEWEAEHPDPVATATRGRASLKRSRTMPSLMELDFCNPTDAKKPKRQHVTQDEIACNRRPMMPSIKNLFVYGKSKLILALFNQATSGSEGEMHVIPTLDSPFSTFIRELGVAAALFRRNTRQHFTMGVGSVNPGVSIVVPFEVDESFWPSMPTLRSCNLPLLIRKEHQAYEYGDVGVTLLKSHKENDRIIGFSFVFPLKNYQQSRSSPPLPPAFRIGRYQNRAGIDLIKKLQDRFPSQAFFFRLRSEP